MFTRRRCSVIVIISFIIAALCVYPLLTGGAGATVYAADKHDVTVVGSGEAANVEKGTLVVTVEDAQEEVILDAETPLAAAPGNMDEGKRQFLLIGILVVLVAGFTVNYIFFSRKLRNKQKRRNEIQKRLNSYMENVQGAEE